MLPDYIEGMRVLGCARSDARSVVLCEGRPGEAAYYVVVTLNVDDGDRDAAYHAAAATAHADFAARRAMYGIPA